ncbi:hypothetical protein AGMMS50233_04980 [Endomicrobiia bacterium]|nr:hypothetical protein AGMMS50233_04980 [Endomicrobiia bacterium]
MKTKKVVIAIALFGLVLSSCKGCPHKEKDKNKTNPVVRVDEDTPKSNTDEDTPKSKVEEYLKAKGADDAEIRQMLKIEKENFGEGIGHIVYDENNHYYYEGHDTGWTHCNSGLYAVKRLLFVLGKHGIVDKDLWYRYTDSQLRQTDIALDECETIIPCTLKTLMEDLDVPASYRGIYDKNGDELEWVRTLNEKIAHYTALHEQAKHVLEEFDAGRLPLFPFNTREELKRKELNARVIRGTFENERRLHIVRINRIIYGIYKPAPYLAGT